MDQGEEIGAEMSAREKILQRLRRNLGQTRAHATPQPVSRQHDGASVPAIAQYTGDKRNHQFLSCLKAMHGTYTELSKFDDLPAALASELRNRNLAPSVRTGHNPDILARDWKGIDISVGPGRIEEPATLSRAFCASAETGTVALLSSPENPATLNFLGETHFVILKTTEIEAGFEGLWQRLRKSGKDPRTVNLITGPSRTADIEQSLELGAHGPLALHVFLIKA